MKNDDTARRRAALVLPAALAVLAPAVAPDVARAEIVDVRIAAVRPFAEGTKFGGAHAYERVTGTARGELDPAEPRNATIVNLNRAPRNARGKVEYEVDFDLLRPVDGGNRKLMFEVTNRGRKLIGPYMMQAPAASANDPRSVEDAGNGFFLRDGWTMAWTGWDPDAPKAGGGMTIRVPAAMDGDKPIRRTIRDEFQSGTRGPVVREFRLSYEAASVDPAESRLTVRRREGDARQPVPAAEWRFKDSRTIEILTPGNAGSGPAVGAIYEFHYPAKNPWVLGIGFAATRDFVAFLRHGGASGGPASPAGAGIRKVVAVGISQSGRYLRDHVAQGFNQDLAGRKVFDGVLAHISGVGRVFLNAEFGQPPRTNTQHEDHLFPENRFPFSAARSTDPGSGREGALLRGDGFDPLLIETNTSTEYWQKGASLLTTDPAGTRDLQLPAGARAYLVAGTQHGGRWGLGTQRGACANDRNPHDPGPALRALFVALDEWVDKGVAPPPSAVPTIADGTLVAPDNAAFPKLPDFVVAPIGNEVVVVDDDWVDPKPGTARRYRGLVPKTDADGNEVAGIRLPDIAVPVATYTGWNLYKRPYPEGELCDRDGSYLPFARDRSARERTGDPRPSLRERYGSADAWIDKVGVQAAALQAQRLLLADDAQAYVTRARQQAAKLFGGQ